MQTSTILLPKLQLFFLDQYGTQIESSRMIWKAQKHKKCVCGPFIFSSILYPSAPVPADEKHPVTGCYCHHILHCGCAVLWMMCCIVEQTKMSPHCLRISSVFYTFWVRASFLPFRQRPELWRVLDTGLLPHWLRSKEYFISFYTNLLGCACP